MVALLVFESERECKSVCLPADEDDVSSSVPLMSSQVQLKLCGWEGVGNGSGRFF